MNYADESSYEAVINELQRFVTDAGEQCEVLTAAGDDCVDNTDGDPAASKASAAVHKCASDIGKSLEEINDVIKALQEELEAIREAAASANFDE